jgi:hypothetical protein
VAETVRVVAHRVLHCGLYHRGAAQPEFASYSELIPRLAAWIEERTVGESCTFVHDDSSGEEENALLCSNFAEVGGDWLFEMWQRSTSAEGMGTLNLDSKVGEGAAKVLKVGARAAAGVSRLFWLLPDEGLLCTVQLQNRATARPEFQRYLRDFIRFGPYSLMVESSQGLDLRRWTRGPGEPAEALVPRFRLGTSVDLRRADQVRAQRESIISILYRGRMDINPVREKMRGMTGLLDRFTRVRVPLNANKSFKLNMELPQTPSQEELEDLIAEASNTETRHPPDVGFRMAGDRRVVWLHSRQANKVDEMEVHRLNALQVDARQVLGRLRARFRSRLLEAQGER